MFIKYTVKEKIAAIIQEKQKSFYCNFGDHYFRDMKTDI